MVFHPTKFGQLYYTLILHYKEKLIKTFFKSQCLFFETHLAQTILSETTRECSINYRPPLLYIISLLCSITTRFISTIQTIGL